MLMGHLDVVPVQDPSVWEVPPFSGEIRDGFIYGRGTIDSKQTVLGILKFCRPSQRAMLLRTTTAITEFHGGIKDNVMTLEAGAVVNHRIHPS